jgi:hypothetical protein
VVMKFTREDIVPFFLLMCAIYCEYLIIKTVIDFIALFTC